MILLQALINGLVSGTLLAVPAIGFTAMFAVLRFPNFSVSGVATLGAFAGYVAYGAGFELLGSLAVAFFVAGAVGLFFDRTAHLPLVKQGALPAAIASIASGLVLENVVRLGFGNDLRGFDRPIHHFGSGLRGIALPHVLQPHARPARARFAPDFRAGRVPDTDAAQQAGRGDDDAAPAR